MDVVGLPSLPIALPEAAGTTVPGEGAAQVNGMAFSGLLADPEVPQSAPGLPWRTAQDAAGLSGMLGRLRSMLPEPSGGQAPGDGKPDLAVNDPLSQAEKNVLGAGPLRLAALSDAATVLVGQLAVTADREAALAAEAAQQKPEVVPPEVLRLAQSVQQAQRSQVKAEPPKARAADTDADLAPEAGTDAGAESSELPVVGQKALQSLAGSSASTVEATKSDGPVAKKGAPEDNGSDAPAQAKQARRLSLTSGPKPDGDGAAAAPQAGEERPAATNAELVSAPSADATLADIAAVSAPAQKGGRAAALADGDEASDQAQSGATEAKPSPEAGAAAPGLHFVMPVGTGHLKATGAAPAGASADKPERVSDGGRRPSSGGEPAAPGSPTTQAGEAKAPDGQTAEGGPQLRNPDNAKLDGAAAQNLALSAGTQTSDMGMSSKSDLGLSAENVQRHEQLHKPDGPVQNMTDKPASANVSPYAAQVLSAQKPLGRPLAIAIGKTIQDGRESLRISLDPKDLGQLDVQLSIERNGALRAVVTASSQTSAELIRQDLPTLVRSLADAGLKVDGSSIRLEVQADARGQSQHRQSREQHESNRSAAPSAENQFIEEERYAMRPLRAGSQIELRA